jgi:hypothetical protein
VVDGNSDNWNWLQTEVYAEKEIGWLSVQLSEQYRIREIDLANSRPINTVYSNNNPYTINGAFLSAGTDLNSSLNEQCGDEISYSQSYSCDIIGNYIGVWFVSDGVQIFDEEYYGYGRHISF